MITFFSLFSFNIFGKMRDASMIRGNSTNTIKKHTEHVKRKVLRKLH